jgi:peptidoglycan/xylan/chitin deacetylase (PgdA/CDA1 family)
VVSWPALERAVERELAAPEPLARRLRRRLPRRLPEGVYVLGYHSVPSHGAHEPWEEAYDRVLTWADDFERHLELLRSLMEPITLAEAESAHGFVVTFDDGYANVAGAAADACERLGIRPTVFVSADFCAGRAVYHRVLLSTLVARGLVPAARLAETKDGYVPGRTEAEVEALWQELCPGEPPPRAHLDFPQLRELAARGWTVGNHGRSHATLAAVDDLDAELSGNEAELRAAGLDPLPWIAYPNGAARHVGPNVKAWMDAHPEQRGLFGAGGVNLRPSRDEWLRIPVGDWDARQLELRLHAHADATRRALARA